jgi:hypothetical protein
MQNGDDAASTEPVNAFEFLNARREVMSVERTPLSQA